MKRSFLPGFGLALLLPLCPGSASILAAEVTVIVQPERMELVGPGAYQQLLVTVTADGKTHDRTRTAGYRSSQPGVVEVGPDGLARALATGEARISVSVEGRSIEVTAVVRLPEREPAVNFTNEVAPLLSKHGCNAAGCHGKASGQGGFKLSLFGADPLTDFEAIVKEGRGRRVFAAAPEQSLVLLKAAGLVPHGGGRRVERGTLSYQVLLRWLRQGTPIGSADDPILERITLEPEHRLLGRKDTQQLTVRAYYSDGRARDVTRHTEYQSNEVAIATVDDSGLVLTQNLTGETAIMARYMGKIAVFRATVPSGKLIARYPDFQVGNAIDELALKKWKQLGIAPSPLCSDEEFLRRAYLDISGMLPGVEDVRRFSASTDADKRNRLIDYLLQRREYSSFFALKWADILRNAELAGADKVSFHFQEWLREHFAENRPYDQMVRGIVAATGRYNENPGVNWFWQMRDDLPWQPTADTSQVFLGTRINCAQCHHHPFERWSQDDYYGFAGFYGRMRMEGGDINVLRFNAAPTPTRVDPRTKKPMTPRALGGPNLDVPANEDPREHLVDWMRRADNPFFARALVNRYWAHFLGRGLVEPIDDLRDTNPASNPELLDLLAREFIASGFDLKKLIRTITTSSVYQLSSVPTEHNADDRQNFARYYARRVQAEVLLDIIDQATASKTTFPGMSRNSTAKDLPHEGFRSYFLDVFGRPPRTNGCECARGAGVSLAQALHLLHAPEIERKVSDPKGRAARLAADARTERDRIEEAYLATLSRRPMAEELEGVRQGLEKAKDRQQAYQDLLWALINTREFAFNH